MSDHATDGLRTVGATETSFTVIERLRNRGGATVTELAAELDVSKSTVHNHLRTLENLGYVVTEESTYHLGLQFLDLGNAARDRLDLYEVTKRGMDELVFTTEENGYVMAEEEGRGVYIYQSSAERGVQTDSHIGTTVDLHATAVGKAYLAFLDESRRDELLGGIELRPRTESTYTDRDAFEAELDSVRERGFAFNDEERFVGMRAVGAPVLGPDDEVLASVSVAGPATRLEGERYRSELPELVTKTARLIGIRATYS